jgi:hypothetical protein
MVTATSCSCSCTVVASESETAASGFLFSDQSGPDWANCGHSFTFGFLFNHEERKRKDHGNSLVFRLVGHPRAHYDHARERSCLLAIIKGEVNYIVVST